MIQTKTQRKHLYTPLRYPGGKTSLFPFLDKVISSHDWESINYIEPYAGGAGAALSLLILDKVKSIVINDYDPAIYSFWLSVVESTNDFVQKIESTEVSIEEWDKQKEIYEAADTSDRFELGFATFFLNRTNRSGILNAGPIGGKHQDGEWKIDARYNKEVLCEKIRKIGNKRAQITISNKDGVDIIEEYSEYDDSFLYIDPPYYVKGANLYLNAFGVDDHENLARALNQKHSKKWILTYDSEPEIMSLYPKRNYRPYDLNYSAHQNSKTGSEIMFFSDSIDMERIDRI